MDEHATILLVDDSRLQRTLLAQQLRRGGYKVVEAEDGASANRLLEAERPDAVLLDWELPDVDGPALLESWQKHREHRWVPVLMVTSHDSPTRIRQVLALGAVDFLRKPPGEVELDARLRAALRVRRLQLDLLKLATRDALTNLFNRRVLLERLESELARGSRYRRPLAVALIDVDHFKRVNDTHGHDVGDLVLKQMADLLIEGTRDVDTVARFGGEEFVVLFPETTMVGAQQCLERVRARARDLAWGRPEQHLTVTFSAGVSDLVVAPRNAAEQLKAADTALYRAKRGGRDRVELFAGPLPESA